MHRVPTLQSPLVTMGNVFQRRAIDSSQRRDTLRGGCAELCQPSLPVSHFSSPNSRHGACVAASMTKMRDAGISSMKLSARAGALRLSLLAALGLPSWACGGTAISAADGGGGTVGDGGNSGQGRDPKSYAGDYIGGSYGGSNFSPAGSSGAGGSPALCQSPQLDPITHLTTCASGLVHRAQATTCAVHNSYGEAGGESSAGAGGEVGCSSDATCAGLPYGWCATPFPGAPFPDPAHCMPGCVQDSDCGDGSVCQCEASLPAGHCVPSSCQVDANCGANSLCARIRGTCGYLTFQCSQGEDECTSGDNQCPSGICALDQSGRNVCGVGVCGGPS
jgi:hypothetical protein